MRGRQGGGYGGGVQDREMKQPWCLVASERKVCTRTLIRYYAKRWGIETSFRDIKDMRFGIGMSAIRVSSPHHRDRILLLSAFASADGEVGTDAHGAASLSGSILYNLELEVREYMRSLMGPALSGSFWISTQWFLNKFVTAGAMLLIAFFLSPEDYGVAATAFAVVAFIWILQPEVMGDVLLAYPRHLQLLAPTARRLAIGIAAISASATLIAIPVVLLIYDTYPPVWLGSLLAVLAIRPFCTAFSVAPLSNLRQKLEFRRIAVIDGSLQLAATFVSVGSAAFGGRAASLVVPQVLNEAGRAIYYTYYTRMGSIHNHRRFRRKLARFIMRSYLKSAGAQYIHNVLISAEIVILGYVSGGYQAGLFGFAFMLAGQANAVIAGRIGMVLQSILGELQQQPARQIEGFLRAQQVLGAVCVPIALLQAVLAEPIFYVLFAAKWQPAVPVFQALSLLQAVYFATGPSMACLKSQRRFHTLLIWQGAQVLLSLPAFWFAAEQGGAVGVALASVMIWSISIPTSIWLCAGADGKDRLLRSIGVFFRPWIVGAPVFVPGYIVIQWLHDHGMLGNVVAIAIIAPLLLFAALFISWLTDRDIRAIADRMWQMGRHRIGRG